MFKFQLNQKVKHKRTGVVAVVTARQEGVVTAESYWTEYVTNSGEVKTLWASVEEIEAA